jgi:hypothetical protein
MPVQVGSRWKSGSWPAPKPAVDQGDNLGASSTPPDLREREQFVLVAAPGPATVAPQQVAVDGGHRRALGGGGVTLGVVEHFLAGPGSELAGLGGVLDEVEVASLLDRGFRGLAKARQHWHAPIGDRRTKDRLTDAQRAFNRLQAGLRALVEQAIAHLANAWSLRRWRGLLYRVRDVYRAAGALVCLGRWLHRVPT